MSENRYPESIMSSSPPLFVYFTMVIGLTIGFVGQVCSLFVLVVILANKSLRTPCFILIAAGSVGSFLVAAFYFGRGIDVIGDLTGTMLPVNRSVLVCLLTAGLEAMFGLPFHALITCLIGVDRTISLVFPTRYRSFGSRYVVYMLIGSVAITLIEEAVGFATASLSTEILCRVFPDALNPLFGQAFGAINISYFVAILIIYGILLLSFVAKKRKAQIQGSRSDLNVFVKQQSAAMEPVMFMVGLYFVFGIVPEILINIALNLGSARSEWADIVMVVGDALKVASSMIEFFSLMLRSQKFRECAKATLRGKRVTTTSVHVIEVSQRRSTK